MRFSPNGIRVVGKNEKLESFKLESLKLESFCLSWTGPSDDAKNPATLERTQRSWKEPSVVRKNRVKLKKTDRSWKVSLKFESFAAVGKFWLKLQSFNFHISIHGIDLSKLNSSFLTSLSLSKFNINFPTSSLTFQLRHTLSNFGSNFPTSIFPISFWTFQLLVLSNCPFQLHVSHFYLSDAVILQDFTI